MSRKPACSSMRAWFSPLSTMPCGSHAAIPGQNILFQRTGIYADAHRHVPMGLQAVRQLAHVGLPADVAGIDAHLGDAVFHSAEWPGGGQSECPPPAAPGFRPPVARTRPGAGLVVHRNAHDVRPRLRQPRESARGWPPHSRVSVLVMVCTVTGAPPPMSTPPAYESVWSYAFSFSYVSRR